MKTIYRCECCYQEFTTYAECFEHESNHLVPVKVKAVDGEYYSSGWPGKVIVTMENGAEISYVYEGILKYQDEAPANE